jgi:glycosyltransferase involved in cell wall biosynthesis
MVRISVTNDLVTDRRVDKVARTLLNMGFQVELIGRILPDSHILQTRSYLTKRFSLLFRKGPFFYLSYNFRLFLYLLTRKTDVLVANDLDTLLANYLVSKIKGTDLVYDSHEYYTGVPELENRRFVRSVWKAIEKWIFPKLKTVFTVNDSIANLYEQEYGIRPAVLRNVPETPDHLPVIDRTSLGLPENKNIILLQGAGINIQRGAEEAVLAMRYLENCLLLIIGGGDVIHVLPGLIEKYKLEEKVKLLPKQPMEALLKYTVCADLGLTLDKDTNINYRFSLPNKLFDYIQAGLPVLASDLPEVSAIIHHYNIGLITPDHEPEKIAQLIQSMLSDKINMERWRENLKIAARELCWEKEEKVIIENYAKFC